MTDQHDTEGFARLVSQYRRSAAELRPISVHRDGEPGALLLTGVSGFFGRSLVKQLARARPDQEIHCLVRHESGFSTAISGGGATDRIQPLAGDLSRPLLGLSDRKWAELSRDVATIVHAGALVNHSLPLERMVESNVAGTLALLRLASEGRDKRMHFISSVASLGRGNAGSPLDPVPPEPPAGGYAQSKWLAESLMEIGQAAGFGISTYRVGGLGPDSETGEVNLQDWRWLTMRAALESGRWPVCEGGPRWLPVDVAARMVTGVVADDADPAERYHLVAPTGPTWEAVFEEMIRLGYDLEKADRETWFDTMRDRARARDETAMRVLALGLPRPARGEKAGSADGGDPEPVGGVQPESWQPDDLPITLRWAAERGFLHPRAG